MTAQLTDRTTIETFALAGNARLTLVSSATGKRFTYRIKRANMDDNQSPWFVSVLNGSDNDGDYAYMGILSARGQATTYHSTAASKISKDAPSAKAWAWFWAALTFDNAEALAKVAVWHEGSCGRCGRSLTVPASIESGLGPVCAAKV